VLASRFWSGRQPGGRLSSGPTLRLALERGLEEAEIGAASKKVRW